MTLVNYYNENNVIMQLDAAISDVQLNFVVKSGEWDLVDSTDIFRWKIESYDSDGNVIKREVIEAHKSSGDAFIIDSRSVEKCPVDYTATTQTQVAQDFSANDYIILTLSDLPSTYKYDFICCLLYKYLCKLEGYFLWFLSYFDTIGA